MSYARWAFKSPSTISEPANARSYLRSFPFDKIDRSFIQDLSNGAEPLAIVNALAGLAKCLNMTSTAEGVETREQMETLQAIGCAEMQGYLFSKARPANEI